MNTAPLKAYAPAARKAFIAAVSAQAARYGVTAEAAADNTVPPAQRSGDFLLIAGQPFSKNAEKPRRQLIERINAQGYTQTMEAAAYTWFNRFAALRYMELHGYLGHGYRVLSHPQSTGDTTTNAHPELLAHATEPGLARDLPSLDYDKAVALQLDGNQDEALYRLLLKAQCDALHAAMPFLFDRLDSWVELLLPANLLHSDSLIRDLVTAIDEDAWDNIEIIGWLYQFYISEKKDQVIGKVVKSEDIPAATQLFTPNWIVKYMVQNSLGAQWLATYPNSPLKANMDYYIEPAEQTEAVNAQLAAITPDSLDPEALTLIDPACGSGHILVEAYDLFRAIYLERGYRQRDVAQLILEKNLFGLDIDGRAAQLTGFALMMKGRADDRRLFSRGVKLNVMALVDSAGLDVEALVRGVKLADFGLAVGDLEELKALFEHATTFGSLIQVPAGLAGRLEGLRRLSEVGSGDLFLADAVRRLGTLVRQGELLAALYDAVVANPPYMGKGGLNKAMKAFLGRNFRDSKTDLFAAFIERALLISKMSGHAGLITMHQWMFTSSYAKLRRKLFTRNTFSSVAHLGSRAFEEISGEIVQTVAFVLRRAAPPKMWRPVFIRAIDDTSATKRVLLRLRQHRYDTHPQSRFESMPSYQIAYWLRRDDFEVLECATELGQLVSPRVGLATGDNDLFVRCWFEVDSLLVARGCEDRDAAHSTGGRWFPFQKGGGYQRWYGNDEYVVDWENDGHRIKHRKELKLARGEITANNSKCWNEDHYFKPALTWTDISSRASLSMRLFECGTIPSSAGNVILGSTDILEWLIAILMSSVAETFIAAINPTLHANPGDVAQIPILIPSSAIKNKLAALSLKCHKVSKDVWESSETSPGFLASPLSYGESSSIEMAAEICAVNILDSRAVIIACELEIEQVLDSLYLRTEPNLVERERHVISRLSCESPGTTKQSEQLVSYAIGCMMGRYSLDEPGLIYAHSGNLDFDASRYATFPADDDGIVPLTDAAWFDDDACQRLVDFINTAWDDAGLEDNLTFLADNLAPKKTESSRETLRRYLCTGFFKDHLKTYKKRPIYWLFSSGKQRAFQCLVYLHRYNEGTLARMRSEYVIPLQGKMAARIEQLQGDIAVATSTAHRKRLEKEKARLEKQQVELLGFDEKLRHFADKRIALDLDDGVKVNYGKFGELLAEVKAVHGKKVVG